MIVIRMECVLTYTPHSADTSQDPIDKGKNCPSTEVPTLWRGRLGRLRRGRNRNGIGHDDPFAQGAHGCRADISLGGREAIRSARRVCLRHARPSLPSRTSTRPGRLFRPCSGRCRSVAANDANQRAVKSQVIRHTYGTRRRKSELYIAPSARRAR